MAKCALAVQREEVCAKDSRDKVRVRLSHFLPAEISADRLWAMGAGGASRVGADARTALLERHLDAELTAVGLAITVLQRQSILRIEIHIG